MSQWISVKDELPDACTRVLTVETHGYISVCMFYPMKKEFHELHEKRNVKYWMPLPNTPEEK